MATAAMTTTRNAKPATNAMTAIVVGTLAVVGVGALAYALTRKKAAPQVVPPPPPQPLPTNDPQVQAALQAIQMYAQQLQMGGGGTPAQREQMAAALEAQASALAAAGGSPQAVSLLRQAAATIRAGQTPVIPPAPPAPQPQPQPQTSPLTIAQARALIAAAEAQAALLPPDQRSVLAQQLMAAANQPGVDPTARQELMQAAMRIGGFAAPATGLAIGAPTFGPGTSVAQRYALLFHRCNDFVQGRGAIDIPTLGAADRLASELYATGDGAAAQNLGAIASQAYVRAVIPRPMAFSP